MALPLPRVIPDAPQGGYVMGGLQAANALTRQNLENQYLPMQMQAETASKLAYANLMGPQFLAKLMANDPVLANMTEEQKTNALSKLYNAGTGQGTGAAIMGGNPMSMPAGGNSGGALNALFNILGVTGQGSQQAPQPTQINNNSSGSSGGYAYNPDGTNQVASADEIRAAVKRSQDNLNIPSVSPTDNVDPRRRAYMDQGHSRDQPIPASFRPDLIPASPPQPPAAPSPTFAEKTGSYKGVVQEGEEAGKIRAKDIEDLNNQVFNSETALTTLGDVAKVISSPEFEQIRQVPLAGKHELAYYAKEGTPEQQQMVGQYYALTGNLVKDASRDFAGSFRKGEQSLLEGMKPGPSDTVDTAKGKTESITYLLQMLKQRAQMTSEIMNKYHVNKGQASEIADRTVNGPAIREQIHDSLNPTVTVRNKKTGKVKTIPAAEARKLGALNV